MSQSIDVDVGTPNDFGKMLDSKLNLDKLYGEESNFCRNHGFYLDPINVEGLVTLPEDYLTRVIYQKYDDLFIGFLDPHDAAISKYTRYSQNDKIWIDYAIRNKIINLSLLLQYIKNTNFMDYNEAMHVKNIINNDIQSNA